MTPHSLVPIPGVLGMRNETVGMSDVRLRSVVEPRWVVDAGWRNAGDLEQHVLFVGLGHLDSSSVAVQLDDTSTRFVVGQIVALLVGR